MWWIMLWNDVLTRWFVPCAVLAVVSCDACLKEESGSETSDMVSIDVRLDVSDGGGAVDVRSILPEESIETMVTDVTLASYDEDGNLVNALYYENAENAVKLYVSGKKTCDIYVLANMGDMTHDFPLQEKDVCGMVFRLESYDAVRKKGIPMCGLLEGFVYEEGKGGTVHLQRLFARLNVRIMHTGLSGASSSDIYAYTLQNKSLYLRQANRRLKPFAPGGSAAETAEDILDLSDYNPDLADADSYKGSLSPQYWGPGLGYFQDTTVVLYVPENVQGVLLPGNDDPFRKVGERIADVEGRNYEKLCTFLEFNAVKPGKSDGYGGDITYRCYLGEDNVSDFSIRRNARYDVTLDFTDEGFLLDNWKVVRGDGWVDTRTLCFLDAPYVVYPGTTEYVVLHYNKFDTSSDTGSVGPVSDLICEFDEKAFAAAGLTCTFMGSEKIAGTNGYNDYYFKVTASKDARIGTAFPIRVSLADGTKSDVAVINVSEVGKLSPVWDFCPEYVSQTGLLEISGAVDGLMPLSVSVSDPSVLECVQCGKASFKITALKKGTAELSISNSDRSQTVSLFLEVKAPILKVSDIYIALAPDGEVGSLDYCYTDANGNVLRNVDQGAYNRYLRPLVSGCEFLSVNSDTESIRMCIDKLSASGKSLETGSYYYLTVYPRDCPGVVSHGMRAYVVDPFSKVSVLYEDEINDYTLFSSYSVPGTVRAYFSDEIAAEVELEYEVQPVDADVAYVSSSLEPVWKGDFSNDNEVFRSDYNPYDSSSSLGASVKISQNVVTNSSGHSAGRHYLQLHVKNRYSGECLSKTIANLDVYVHTAIGAEASFGSLICNYPSGGASPSSTVAGVYNYLAGYNFYSPYSTDMIYYMDVTVKYLTNISGVYVFNSMQKGQKSYTNVMNGLDVVRPSVGDGETDSNHRVLYSVCTDGGQRVGMCGESYGTRKGLETVLYRALAMQTYSEALTQSELYSLFLGYTSLTKFAYCAPCYEIHDMNLSSDMSKNLVSKNYPFYFSPTSCRAYRDDLGRGYHVIHTLSVIAPDTNGWINLL